MKAILKKAADKGLRVMGMYLSRDYDLKNTVVLVASPRGGSTWLAELINTLPGHSILWEPLSLNEVPEARNHGFKWRTYIPPGTDWIEGERFLDDILTGRFLNRQTTQACKFVDFLKTRAWIVKFCRAHMFLRWMTEKFDTKRPILLIRHPCAVVSSQMRHGNWRNIRQPYVDSRFLEDYPQFSDILGRITSLEEALSGTWCLEYFAPLVTPKPHPWLLVTYEKLVRDGEVELQRVFKALEFDVPDDAKRHLRIPSFTTRAGSSVEGKEDQLALWKERLSRQQIRKILDVVSAFGLDFYTEELEPDYDRLYGERPVKARI